MTTSFNDNQTMKRLMDAPIRENSYTSFCQWCARQRHPVKRELLLCYVCDESADRA